MSFKERDLRRQERLKQEYPEAYAKVWKRKTGGGRFNDPVWCDKVGRRLFNLGLLTLLLVIPEFILLAVVSRRLSPLFVPVAVVVVATTFLTMVLNLSGGGLRSRVSRFKNSFSQLCGLLGLQPEQVEQMDVTVRFMVVFNRFFQKI